MTSETDRNISPDDSPLDFSDSLTRPSYGREADYTLEPSLYVPSDLVTENDQTGGRATVSRFQKIANLGTSAANATVIAFEAQPWFNDTTRTAIAAAVAVATRRPELSTAVYMASTMLVEGSGSISAASVLKSDNPGRAYNTIQKILDFKLFKFIVPPVGEKISLAKEGFVALYMGTTWQLSLKERENNDINKRALRRRGLVATLAMQPLIGTEGYLGSESITNLTKPLIVLPSVIVLVGIFKSISYLKKKIIGVEPKEEGVGDE